jgi:transposase, IS5 family
LKSDYRLVRNYLRGFIGDSMNLLLAASAWNLRKWMRFLAAFFRLLLQVFPRRTLAHDLPQQSF